MHSESKLSVCFVSMLWIELRTSSAACVSYAYTRLNTHSRWITRDEREHFSCIYFAWLFSMPFLTLRFQFKLSIDSISFQYGNRRRNALNYCQTMTRIQMEFNALAINESTDDDAIARQFHDYFYFTMSLFFEWISFSTICRLNLNRLFTV